MLPKVFAYTVISAASMKDVFCTSSILAIQLSQYTGHTPLLWCFSRGCHCNIFVLCHISTAVMRTVSRGHYCSTMLPKTVPRGTTNAQKNNYMCISHLLQRGMTNQNDYCTSIVFGLLMVFTGINRLKTENDKKDKRTM